MLAFALDLKAADTFVVTIWQLLACKGELAWKIPRNFWADSSTYLLMGEGQK